MCARARALAHVTARAGARTQLHSACTRILFRARAVRATVTLTTFPHPRPPDPAPPRVPRRCDAVGSEWWRGGERREERHVPSVTSRGVHCNAVQCRRRSSLLRRDLGPCGGVRRVGDVGPRRRTLFDTENEGGGKVLSRDWNWSGEIEIAKVLAISIRGWRKEPERTIDERVSVLRWMKVIRGAWRLE